MATIVVTTLDDTTDSKDGLTSLREAIATANADDGADTIDFDPSLAGGTLTLTQGAIEITDELTIDGSNADPTILGITITGDASGNDELIDGTSVTDLAASVAADTLSDNTRLFTISDSSTSTTFIGLTLTGGRTTADNASGSTVYSGGAIRSDASVAFQYVTLAGNSTTGARASGGAVYSVGAITLTNATVSGNATSGDNAPGGAAFGLSNIAVESSTISGNSTSGAYSAGGGIATQATATITNSIVLGNDAVGSSDPEISANLQFTGNNIVGSDATDFDTSGYTGVENEDPTDIFAETAEVLDGNAEATGVYAGVLADNGGLVPTVALLSDSTNPALEGGDASALGSIDEDGRGLPRPADLGLLPEAAPDIGAFELQSLPATAPQTFTVTTVADELATDAADASVASMGSYLSLREAVFLANKSGYADTIEFDESLADGLIRLTLGELEITEQLTIDGGEVGLTITGDALGDDKLVTSSDLTDLQASRAAETLSDNSRVFNVTDSSADFGLSGLTLTGGYTGGKGSNSSGGALRSEATLSISQSYFSGNGTGGDEASGGAIYASNPVTLSGSTFSGNGTSGETALGGAIYVYGNLTSGSLVIEQSTLSDNYTLGNYASGGAAIALGAMTVTGSTISGNSTQGTNARGGGLTAKHTLELADSTVASNSTAGLAAYGGGLYVFGLATIVGSSVNDNSTSGDFARGGGLFVASYAYVTNSTFADNSTSGQGASGGGIFFNVSLELVSSTVTSNATTGSDAYGGGIGPGFDASILLGINSLVLGNAALDGSADELVGGAGVAFYGNNLVGTDASAFDTAGYSNVSNADPTLVFAATAEVGTSGTYGGVLADNGGATQTVALLSSTGNPALGSGDNSLLYDPTTGDSITTDQRGAGYLRPYDSLGTGTATTDLGAYELQSLATTSTLGSGDDDNLVGDERPDRIEGRAGHDRIVGRGGDDLLLGGAGRDLIRGNVGNDVILGESGPDRLFGGGGHDRIEGGSGADTILGGSGDDVILGGSGADRIEGGRGSDSLTGGSGADTFVLRAGEGDDLVIDFETGQDRVDLREHSGISGATEIVMTTSAQGDAVAGIGGDSLTFQGLTWGSSIYIGDFLV